MKYLYIKGAQGAQQELELRVLAIGFNYIFFGSSRVQVSIEFSSHRPLQEQRSIILN